MPKCDFAKRLTAFFRNYFFKSQILKSQFLNRTFRNHKSKRILRMRLTPQFSRLKFIFKK
jgi:hypothetical protein